jgi:Flp pilus assembly protein TadG
MTVRPARDERGASLVEFALVAPVFFLLLLGTITGGLALSHKLDLSTAAREAARYGSTLPENEYSATDGTDWAAAVAAEALNASGGALDDSGATICVALVEGSSGSTTVYDPTGGTAFFYEDKYNGSSWVSTGATTAPCYGDSGADSEARVQVKVTRPDSIEAVFYSYGLKLEAEADARFEYSL